MDKRKLIEAIREKLAQDLELLKSAARAAHEAATHEESKPENEYDTRGLEAAYLAGAQAKRAAEIEEQIALFKFFDLKTFGPHDPIASSALVEISTKGRRAFVLMMSKGGGISLTFEGKSVQVVTPNSPLGEALLDLKSGDTAIAEVGDQTREYEIISVR